MPFLAASGCRCGQQECSTCFPKMGAVVQKKRKSPVKKERESAKKDSFLKEREHEPVKKVCSESVKKEPVCFKTESVILKGTPDKGTSPVTPTSRVIPNKCDEQESKVKLLLDLSDEALRKTDGRAVRKTPKRTIVEAKPPNSIMDAKKEEVDSEKEPESVMDTKKQGDNEKEMNTVVSEKPPEEGRSSGEEGVRRISHIVRNNSPDSSETSAETPAKKAVPVSADFDLNETSTLILSVLFISQTPLSIENICGIVYGIVDEIPEVLLERMEAVLGSDQLKNFVTSEHGVYKLIADESQFRLNKKAARLSTIKYLLRKGSKSEFELWKISSDMGSKITSKNTKNSEKSKAKRPPPLPPLPIDTTDNTLGNVPSVIATPNGVVPATGLPCCTTTRSPPLIETINRELMRTTPTPCRVPQNLENQAHVPTLPSVSDIPASHKISESPMPKSGAQQCARISLPAQNPSTTKTVLPQAAEQSGANGEKRPTRVDSSDFPLSSLELYALGMHLLAYLESSGKGFLLRQVANMIRDAVQVCDNQAAVLEALKRGDEKVLKLLFEAGAKLPKQLPKEVLSIALTKDKLVIILLDFVKKYCSKREVRQYLKEVLDSIASELHDSEVCKILKIEMNQICSSLPGPIKDNTENKTTIPAKKDKENSASSQQQCKIRDGSIQESAVSIQQSEFPVSNPTSLEKELNMVLNQLDSSQLNLEISQFAENLIATPMNENTIHPLQTVNQIPSQMVLQMDSLLFENTTFPGVINNGNQIGNNTEDQIGNNKGNQMVNNKGNQLVNNTGNQMVSNSIQIGNNMQDNMQAANSTGMVNNGNIQLQSYNIFPNFSQANQMDRNPTPSVGMSRNTTPPNTLNRTPQQSMNTTPQNCMNRTPQNMQCMAQDVPCMRSRPTSRPPLANHIPNGVVSTMVGNPVTNGPMTRTPNQVPNQVSNQIANQMAKPLPKPPNQLLGVPTPPRSNLHTAWQKPSGRIYTGN